MSKAQHPIIVLGAANVGDKKADNMAKYDTPDEVKIFLDTFYERGGRHIDTSRNYSPGAVGSSEPRLGAVDAGSRFNIDTKILGLPGNGPFHNAQQIKASINASIADLALPAAVKIDVMYLHMPDRETPFEETYEAIDQAYQEGKFKRFGLSNYTADEVEQFVAIGKEKGYVAPTVYQGQYNPVVRSGEESLFPVLKKHGIAFYAYSPAAAGVFVGGQKNAPSGGRFDTSHRVGQHYMNMYSKPKIASAVDKTTEVAAKHGINGHAAALRWTTYHSKLDPANGDTVIIGASSTAQLAANLDIIDQGPLPQDVVEAVDEVYGQLGEDAIAYHL
ncbi:ldo keto [Diaporthe amygdali]|uniref:ldo keto n=1 Tax=Phomopsis amygdali TaxID=1214568 RepID=UPI0022FDD960|nr:ldo keto [Diaporthe amygdali]KAJ0114189.1 ldo keto [Diaporthe amygdali]